LDFLKFLSNPEKLEKLFVQNNPELVSKGLDSLSKLTGLKELDISDCPFEGSLRPLENLNKLKEINISRTNISEGLEDLPESCRKLCCELDYSSKTMEIIKELGKSTKEGDTN